MARESLTGRRVGCWMGCFVLSAVVVGGGCGTTGASGPRTPAAERATNLDGVVVLADGRAVPHARLTLRCGAKGAVARTQTDAEGRFRFAGVPGAGCHLAVRGTSLEQAVEGNLLRGSAALRLVLPRLRRVELVLAHKDGRKELLQLDESLPGAARFEAKALRLEVAGQRLTVDLSRDRVLPSETPRPFNVVSLRVTRRSELPLFARSAPRRKELMALPLRKERTLTTLGKVLGKRTLLWVGPCRQVDSALTQDLNGLLASHGTMGLRAAVLTTDACEITGAAYQGGAAALWALSSKGGELLLLDETGSLRWRRKATKGAEAVAAASKHLAAHWPLFAAVRKVTVRKSPSVSAAQTQRLLEQANKLTAKRDFRAAQRVLDEILVLSPAHAEARKQRALTKAALGDLTGAMSEVGWWRDEFGDEAADELMDAVKKTTPAKIHVY